MLTMQFYWRRGGDAGEELTGAGGGGDSHWSKNSLEEKVHLFLELARNTLMVMWSALMTNVNSIIHIVRQGKK